MPRIVVVYASEERTAFPTKASRHRQSSFGATAANEDCRVEDRAGARSEDGPVYQSAPNYDSAGPFPNGKGEKGVTAEWHLLKLSFPLNRNPARNPIKLPPLRLCAFGALERLAAKERVTHSAHLESLVAVEKLPRMSVLHW